jgi:P4 family phage/plasmid primase-like protien
MNTHIDSYASLGWSVFPVKDKIPLTKDGFKSASNEIETIQKLFHPHPDCNLAIATGEVSGIFVLDIDIKNGAGGKESLVALQKEFGELPTTVTAKTWSNGLHFYFNYPHDIAVGCKAGLKEGIDIRGDGGYVVAPPSTIKGFSYEWVNHPDETAIANAPEWLIQLILKQRATVELPDKDKPITKNRNETLMYMGVNLRRMGFKAAKINKLLQEINKLRCNPPLKENEVVKIANSVAKYTSMAGLNEPHTDTFNAKFFTDLHGENIRYCDSLGGWFIWDGKRWLRDDTFAIVKLAKKTAKKIREVGMNESNLDLIKHGAKTEARGKLDAMIALARANDVSILSSDFDSDDFIVNCQNGILYLDTQELKPHKKSYYCTKVVPVDYNVKAKCPRWMQFLDEVFKGDKELITFMQKAVGYSLSGSIVEQCIFILYGIGMNGKSTFLKHIHKLLGDYALSTPASTLMEKYNEGIPNDIARLKGARFVTTTESSQQRAMAESVVKQLTGDDPISARFLHREYFDFYATFKIFLATNHKPSIKGTDKGIWRRIITIPFDVVISEKMFDPYLDKKLSKEYEGIFAWAVEGYKKWEKEGLKTVSRIDDMKREYQYNSDTLGQFIEDTCVVGPGCVVPSSDLIKTMQHWCKDNGEKIISRTEMNNYLKERGYVKDKGTAGAIKGKNVWHNIGIKHQEGDPPF